MHDSDITATDIFCGAGGSTTGAEQAGVRVKLAMNHWDRAIETHNTNYPRTSHALADVSCSNPKYFPGSTLLIASPECTNHSLSKGQKRKGQGQGELWEQHAPNPAEERSRCTMWDPLRFAEHHRYEAIILENVVDARYWSMWQPWLLAWKALGYDHEIVYFNSMFAHPTPQSRDRMYIVLWKEKNRRPDLKITPLAYCLKCEGDVKSVQSWKNPLRPYGKYGKSGQYIYRCPRCDTQVTPYYYAAANAINWALPTTRIGARKKPLEEKTLRRIEMGLKKFRGQSPYFVQVNKTTDRVRSVATGVFPTQTAINGLGLVHPFIFSMNHSQQFQGVDLLEEPMRTQTTYDDTSMVTPPFLVVLRSHSSAHGIEDPLATLVAGGEHQAVITPPQPFLLDCIAEYRVRSGTAPLSTLVGAGNHQSIVYPSWLMTYYQNGEMSPIEDAAPTATTKARHALVTGEESGEQEIRVEDCGFRMLDPEEIKRAMAFPDDYILLGNRREKVKLAGNAVTAPVMKELVKRVIASLS